MIPSAFLRIFRPLDSYIDEERAHWERYILAGGARHSSTRVYREESSHGRGATGLLAASEGDEAEIRLVDGRYYVCPWFTRIRVLASILSFRESAPEEVAEAFVPDSEVRRAASELASLKRREPSAVPSMLQSPWHVPIRWFVLVDDEERHLVADGSGGFRLYYWTDIKVATRRGDRALQVLRRSDLAPVAKLVRDLVQWLGAFSRECVVELDYASVTQLFSWDELDNDHSGQEVQGALSAIGRRGAMKEAAELYQSVAGRWAEARSRESLN